MPSEIRDILRCSTATSPGTKAFSKIPPFTNCAKYLARLPALSTTMSRSLIRETREDVDVYSDEVQYVFQ